MQLQDSNWYSIAEQVFSFHQKKTRESAHKTRSGRGNPGWSLRKTAAALEKSVTTVYRYIRAYQICQVYPEYKKLDRKTMMSVALKIKLE